MNLINGYYSVGSVIFTDKITAILHASKTGEEVEWTYHDDVYNNIDWTIEPELSLDEYYKMRAQQIRDQYDYVVILCSGGADSTNVVKSFLENGIHVDEVIASAPLGGLKDWNNTTEDKSAGNTMSETMLVQLPLMAEIKNKFPNTKITINDYWETLVEYNTDDWLFRSGEWIHPSSAARYDFDRLVHIRALAESGKKIGIVSGIDKPILVATKNRELHLRMVDRAVNVPRTPFQDAYPNVENVLFYWTADMPLLQVKQAHVLAKWIYMPGNEFALSKMLDDLTPTVSLEANTIRTSHFQRAIVPCIYPTTHREIFQGHKPTRMFLGEHDDWFYRLHSKTRTFEMIISDFRNFIAEIDPRFLNRSNSGFKLFMKTYKIGTVADFDKRSLIITS